MMTIIEALVAEHVTFNELFCQIERLLVGVKTANEVKLLGNLVEGLLRGHAEAETNLAYASLDHLLEHRGELDHLYQDHKEIDVQFERVRSAGNVNESRRLLQEALQASRDHFEREEQAIFPLIERTLKPEALAELSNAWLGLNRPRQSQFGRTSAAASESARTAPDYVPTAATP